MLPAMGAAQAVAVQAATGVGYIFWTKDRCSDSNKPGFQAEFDAMTQQEQDRCSYLQETTTQFHNYYVDKIVGKHILSGIRDKFAVARAGGNELAWLEVKTHIKSYLKEADSKYLLDAMASIRREDKSERIAWVLFMKDLRRVATKGGIIAPARLWCTLLLGQVGKPERAAGKFKLPKTDSEREDFVYAEFEDEVKGVAPGTFPEFRCSHVKK